MIERIPNDLIDHLRHASSRHGIPIAEIARRASRAINRECDVVNAADWQTTTGATTPLRFADVEPLPEGWTLSAALRWYLAKYDRGGSAMAVRADMFWNEDGTVEMTGPLDDCKPVAKALRDIRRKVLQVKP